MYDVNEVRLRGNATTKMEMKTLPNGTPKFSFCLATNKSFKKADGERDKRTTFHNIVAFGSIAEICEKLVKKGKKFEVAGEINNRSYPDSRDQNKNLYWSEVVINHIEDMSDRRTEDKTV